jgi:outer membrane lipoprotein-sorting protein
MKELIPIFVILLITGLYSMLFAEELTAYQIMKNVDERVIPDDMETDMTMNLVDKKGRVRSRLLHSYRMSDDKQIMWFKEPADVKGSSFLRLSYDERDDDMWIYLPAFGKVRRIASHAKNGSFMGSDFTYEDMGDRKLDDYEYTLLGEEEVDGRSCWIIENTPKPGVSTDYSKGIAWVWKQEFIVVKSDLYDKKGNLRKQMSQNLVEQDGYWIYDKITMQNLKRKGYTELILENIKLNTGVDENLFKSNQLTRIR